MNSLKILLVEDNEDDAILEMNILEEAGYKVEYERADVLDSIKLLLRNKEWDCIITDYALVNFTGIDVLDLYKKNGLDIPFIMISGTIGEEIAVKAMKAGIHDYIMKDNLSRFVPALERELNEAKNRRQKKKIEADMYAKEVRFQALIEQALDSFFMHDFNGKIIEVNQRACNSLGYTRSELLSMNILDIDPFVKIEIAHKIWTQLTNEKASTHDRIHRRKDGTTFHAEVRLGSCEIDKEIFVVCLSRDITEIKQAEKKILHLNRMYLTLSHINQAIVKIKDKTSLFQEICNIIVKYGNFKMSWIGNIDYEKRIITPIVFAGEENGYLKIFHTQSLDGNAGKGLIGIVLKEKRSIIFSNIETDPHTLPWRKDALERGYKTVSIIPLQNAGKIENLLIVYGSNDSSFTDEDANLLDEIGADISYALNSFYQESQLKIEMEFKKAREEQLRRSQKMEALGQLSGGIAHDFNNILGIIVGSLELAEMNIQEGKIDLALDRLEKTVNATLRGGEITQKLLSFSRKTNNDNEVFNPNKILQNLNEILKLLLVDQELILEINNKTGLIKCNSTDFENAILNLCINARDAAKVNGKIQIRISNEYISEMETYKYNLPIKGGDYIKITVKDNGVGISEENMQNIFIPFFSTKPDGKGTGLGLANVYSFIEQSDAGIRIESEVGKGTEVTLVFPKMEDTIEKKIEINTDIPLNSNGRKKILVVDDEESLLDLLEAILTFSGYTVLRASTSNHALEILLKERDIDLLFTDILLTGSMDGNKLVERALKEFPNMKVLLTSGFPRDLQKNQSQNYPLLQKPYRTDELIKYVERLFKT